MSEHDQTNERETSEGAPTEKKAYETPAIADEGSFETIVLSCSHGTPVDCGGGLAS
jgi:hypothetical protein